MLALPGHFRSGFETIKGSYTMHVQSHSCIFLPLYQFSKLNVTSARSVRQLLTENAPLDQRRGSFRSLASHE